MSNIRTIKLYGDLADICGDSIRLSAICLYEVIEGIKANFPKSIELFEGGKCRICAGLQIADEEPKWSTDTNCNDLLDGINTIHFGIVVTGAGLELAAIIYGYFTAAGFGTIASIALTAISMVAINVAVGLAVSAVAKMFAPKISRNDKEPKDDKSYNLSGPGQQKGIGTTIPLLYGRFRGGSCIISQDITGERMVAAMEDSLRLVSGTNSYNLLANDGAGDGAYVKSVSFAGNTWTSTGTGTSPNYQIFGGGNYLNVSANGDLVVVITNPPAVTTDVSLSYTVAKPGEFGDGDSSSKSSSSCKITYPVKYTWSYSG